MDKKCIENVIANDAAITGNKKVEVAVSKTMTEDKTGLFLKGCPGNNIVCIVQQIWI